MLQFALTRLHQPLQPISKFKCSVDWNWIAFAFKTAKLSISTSRPFSSSHFSVAEHSWWCTVQCTCSCVIWSYTFRNIFLIAWANPYIMISSVFKINEETQFSAVIESTLFCKLHKEFEYRRTHRFSSINQSYYNQNYSPFSDPKKVGDWILKINWLQIEHCSMSMSKFKFRTSNALMKMKRLLGKAFSSPIRSKNRRKFQFDSHYTLNWDYFAWIYWYWYWYEMGLLEKGSMG